MFKNMKLYVGLAFVLASFVAAFILNQPSTKEKTFSFASSYGDKAVSLEASLWEVQDAEYAVLICPGYSCDRQKWRPMADLLISNGLTVMSFDYSGQGASSGTIGFDNAKTDRIPQQIDDALQVLHEKTGMDYNHMILLGHSMGGRSILRLMYDYHDENAETKTSPKDIENLILLSPEVNYHFNAQASLFAGTSDDSQEPWHSFCPSYVEGVNVYLYGSTQDDIVSDEDIFAIAQHLGAEGLPESGTYQGTVTNELGSSITVGVISGVLHSYQMYSPRFGDMINAALTSITGAESRYPAGTFNLVYVAWLVGLLGVGLVLSALNQGKKLQLEDSVPQLIQVRAFLIRKALLWIPGLAAGVLVCSLCVVLPWGSPVMNIPYMCFIAGYGFVMLFAYRKGKFKGTQGNLPALSFRIHGSRKERTAGAAITVGLCFFVWYVLRSSMYRLIPFNARLFWVCFAAILMTVGYYVSGCENDMLRKAKASRGAILVYNLIQYVPLILLVLFYAVLKSYSGMIGQIQNMALMYIFCVPLGNYINSKLKNRLWGSLITGFLFQTLMITSAALIAIF